MARTSTQRSIPIWLFAIAVALIAGRIIVSRVNRAPAATQEEGSRSLVRWVPMEQAANVARQSGKVIMYDFTAAWCGPCHALEDAVFSDQRLAGMINQRFVPVRVVDRQREDGRNNAEVEALQQRYRVRGFPTLVWADAGGEQKTRMEGFGGPEAFERTVENLR
ncbi:MAG TPA: thioredoxin fold domain-containing protein [Thermoanaerobaculia bacterium]|jgi:thiol:disulfide interchange protein